MSLAKILCQTMNSIRTIQPFVFLAADNFRNARLACDSTLLEDFDLLPWIERPEDTLPNRLDFLRFLISRSKRSIQNKKKRKILTRLQTGEIKDNSRAKSSIAQYSSNVYDIAPVLKSIDTNQINISISGFSTPSPQPIEINIKIHNGVSTTERSSTVTRRKPSTRPSSNHQIYAITPSNQLGGSYYLKPPTNLKPLNSYNQFNNIISPQGPSGDYYSESDNTYNIPNDFLSPLKPYVDSFAKPDNTYEDVSSTLKPIRPTAGSYTKPAPSINGASTITTAFTPLMGTHTKPMSFYSHINIPYKPSEGIYTKPADSGYIAIGSEYPLKPPQSGEVTPISFYEQISSIVASFEPSVQEQQPVSNIDVIPGNYQHDSGKTNLFFFKMQYFFFQETVITLCHQTILVHKVKTTMVTTQFRRIPIIMECNLRKDPLPFQVINTLIQTNI